MREGLLDVGLALDLSKISVIASNFPLHRLWWDRGPPTTQRPWRPWVLDGHFDLLLPKFWQTPGLRPREL